MGESGVGKTSLLRAGLAHHLQGDKIPVLYWEALPTEPEAKLLHAVRVCWENEEKAPKTFEELAAAVASGRRVLVIDQAEQLSPDGHPRIFELMRQVAAGDPPYRATWVVAFRREFLPIWRDFELSLPEPVQRRMETLSLQRFLPKAAEKVIAVLAEEGGLPVEQKVIEELVEGVAVEGKVSPADIGISVLVLSELAGGRPDASLSLDDFRESGGQAGLLTRYLERLLEQLPEAERSEVLRGLLSLVDLEKDQRLAEGRTLAEMEESVKPASLPRFAAALRFLASGKARVLEELPGEPARYRLVHERLIPAIRRLTGRLLVEAEQAGLHFERSYQIWSRDQQSGYLLSGRDLRQVLRYRGQLVWGANAVERREFLRRSRRHQGWRRAAVGISLAVAIGLGYLGLSYVEAERTRGLLEGWGLPRDLYDRLGQFEELDLPDGVAQLDWLARARKLKVLRVGSLKLTNLAGLPPSLRKLTLEGGTFISLKGLPSELENPTSP
ncbi:MAG TPA: ATP-binding protein [Thermoanaerobaculia bacterium]|nr:ATP-binding protein [Thermoanaerobaculia bacterium]